MPGQIPSYAKIWAVGHRAVGGIFDDPVVVQEKVDGSQISFAKLDGKLHVRSKGATIIDGASDLSTVGELAGGLGMFSIGVENIAQRFDILPEGIIFRGEYLNKPKHNTLVYNSVPQGNIVIFDATAEGEPIGRQALTVLAQSIGFDVIPELYYGKVGSLEQLLLFLERESYLGGPTIEGFVVKNYGRLTSFGDPMFAKYVSEAFKEKHVKDWKGRNPNSKDVVTNLVTMYRTEPRWAKAVQHLRDAGRLKDEPADIGPLMKEIAEDFKVECEDEVRDALWKHFAPNIIRGVQGGFPEWYKEQLAARAFEDTTPKPPCTCEQFGNGVVSGNDGRLEPAEGCERHPEKFKLVEFIEDELGGYYEQWACDPPAPDVAFSVLRDSWHTDGTVRTIHEVKIHNISLVDYPVNPACTIQVTEEVAA